MINSNKFTKAALILVEAQKMIEKLIGVPIELQFEIINESNSKKIEEEHENTIETKLE